MSEEWGPWIEHDGKGCPCVGQYVHIVFERELSGRTGGGGRGSIAGPREWIGITNPPDGRGSWDWRTVYNRVIHYRIRKPRGLTILEGLLENLPEEVDA